MPTKLLAEDQATRLTILRVLGKAARAAEHELEREMAAGTYAQPGTTVPAMIGTRRLGTVTSESGVEVWLTDEHAFGVWADEVDPRQVEYFSRYEADGTVTSGRRVSPVFVDRVLAEVRRQGQWLNERTGRLEPVPGVTIRAARQVGLRVDTASTAMETVLEGIAEGSLYLPGVLGVTAKAGAA